MIKLLLTLFLLSSSSFLIKSDDNIKNNNNTSLNNVKNLDFDSLLNDKKLEITLNESMINLTEVNDCIVAEKFSNNQLYFIQINNPGQHWSSAIISLKFINKCKEPVQLKNFQVGFKNVIVDGNRDFKIQFINQIGNPWLDLKSTTLNDNYLSATYNTPACNESHCDWAKIASGAVKTIEFNISKNGLISKISVESVIIGDLISKPKGNLQLFFTNIPRKNKFRIPVKVALKDNKEVPVAELTVSPDSSRQSFTLYSLEAEKSYNVFVSGQGDPLTGEYTNIIEQVTDLVKPDQTLPVNISFQNLTTLRTVHFVFEGYLSGLSCDMSFKENSNKYLIKTLQVSGKGISSLKFPVDGEFSINVLTNDSNYTVKLSHKIIPIVSLNNTNSNNLIFLSDSKIADLNITVEFIKKQNNNNAEIGGYFESWSASWAGKGEDHQLAKLAPYISTVLLAFASPKASYTKNSFTGTGLSFSSEFDIIKEAIKIFKSKNPNRRIFLSVGGATYPFNGISEENYQAIKNLVIDLGLDGVDIDFEEEPMCIGVNTDQVSCNTDQRLIEIITKFNNTFEGTGKVVTTAMFHVGAYGTSQFPTNKFGPASKYSGMSVNVLKQAGKYLDSVFIMSYDASNEYNPIDGFDAYKAIYSGKLYLGLEVPPEAWGGHVLIKDEAVTFSDHSRKNGGKGVFIWSLQKTGAGTTAKTFLTPVCKLFDLEKCDAELF